MMSLGQRKKILIVESNDVTAAAFQSRLQEAGYDARSTWSGHEALALLRSNEFDVLLMDNYLPDLHATDFLARLNRLAVQPWVVVMKGDAESAPVRRYRSLGASSIVRKRDVDEVLHAVTACCAKDSMVVASSAVH